MFSAAELAEHRADAESRMGSAAGGSDAVVRRRTGALTTMPNGREVPEWVVVHTGPMRLRGARSGATQSRTVDHPGGQVQQGMPEAHWPAALTVLRDGDHLEVVAGEHAGGVWRIVNADCTDQQTALRTPVVAVQRPEEWS